MDSVFSIDVEEWFHILETDCLSKNYADWDHYPGRVEEVFNLMLSMLEQHNVKATIFFLGWIAEKYPGLVEKAHKNGHEIAAHGYYHELVSDQTEESFYNEMLKTKELLEKITGEKVVGYRAPGFSITKKTVWAYKVLIELGFKYSSSVYPALRSHGSYKEFGVLPRTITFNSKSIIEFPQTILKFPLTCFSCFGGGYFRFFPLFWYNIATLLISNRTRTLIFYIHPRDIDFYQPKFNLPISRYIKSYINIESTKSKMDSILKKGKYTLFKQVVENIKDEELLHTTLCMPNGWEGAYLNNQSPAPTRAEIFALLGLFGSVSI